MLSTYREPQGKEVTGERQTVIWRQNGRVAGSPYPSLPACWSDEMILHPCLGLWEPQPVLGAGAGEFTLCHRDEERAYS